MSSPKEKAEELVEKMSIDWDMCRGQNIQCALIAVDEIIKAIDTQLDPPLEIMAGIEGDAKLIGGIRYWEQVKKEIEKL